MSSVTINMENDRRLKCQAFHEYYDDIKQKRDCKLTKLNDLALHKFEQDIKQDIKLISNDKEVSQFDFILNDKQDNEQNMDINEVYNHIDSLKKEIRLLNVYLQKLDSMKDQWCK